MLKCVKTTVFSFTGITQKNGISFYSALKLFYDTIDDYMSESEVTLTLDKFRLRYCS